MERLEQVYDEFYTNISNYDLEKLVNLMNTPGFNVNYMKPGRQPITPLARAIQVKRFDVAEKLLNRGARFTEFENRFLLNLAVIKNNKELVNFLLSKGFNVENATIDIAKSKGYTDIVNILKSWSMAQVIPASNEAARVRGQGTLDPEHLINMKEFMGEKGTDYGGRRKTRTNKRRTRKTRTNNRRKTNNKRIRRTNKRRR
jgi:hypothetical protein